MPPPRPRCRSRSTRLCLGFHGPPPWQINGPQPADWSTSGSSRGRELQHLPHEGSRMRFHTIRLSRPHSDWWAPYSAPKTAQRDPHAVRSSSGHRCTGWYSRKTCSAEHPTHPPRSYTSPGRPAFSPDRCLPPPRSRCHCSKPVRSRSPERHRRVVSNSGSIRRHSSVPFSRRDESVTRLQKMIYKQAIGETI